MLGVMSQCPDALLCETLFDKVIPRVAGKIDLSFAYVATYAASTYTLTNRSSRAYRRLTLSQQGQWVGSRIRRDLHAWPR